MLGSWLARHKRVATACLASGTLAGLLVASPVAAAPGEIDPSFGEGGLFTFQADPACHPFCVEFFGSYANALLVQRDGKVVLGGHNIEFGDGRVPVPSKALVRANSNGTPDPTFGVGGLAEGPPFGIWHLHEGESGHLLVVGGATNDAGVEDLSSSGVPNDAFGPLGLSPVRWFPSQLPVFDAQIDRYGRVVVVAGAQRVVGGPAGPIEVMRFLPHGVPDREFGANGLVVLHGLSMAGSVRPLSVALQPDGGVLLVGENYLAGNRTAANSPKPKLFLARLTAAGKHVSSFGRRGLRSLSGASSYTSVVVAGASHGRILLAAGSGAEGREREQRPEKLLLMRFLPDGRPDRSFGRDGTAGETLLEGGRFERSGSVDPKAIAFDDHGDPLVAGSHVVRTTDTGSAGSWFLARYTLHGRDCSFGQGGVVFGDGRGSATDMAVQPDGRIVIAGDAGHRFMAARYMGDGTPRTCPGEGKSRPHRQEHRGRPHKRR